MVQSKYQTPIFGSGSGIHSDDDVINYMNKLLVVVKPHVGFNRGSIQNPAAIPGIVREKLSSDELKALDSTFGSGPVFFIPADETKKLATLEARYRYLAKKGSGMGVILAADKPQLEKEAEAIKVEFLAQRDAILANYDNYVEEAAESVRAVFKKIRMQDRRRQLLIKRILSSFPKKEEYAASFSMSMEFVGYKESLVAEARSMVLEPILKVYDLICGALKGYQATGGEDGGTIAGRTIGSLMKFVVATDNNPFANEFVGDLKNTLQDLTKIGSMESKVETLEEALLDVIQYADAQGFALDLARAPYKKEEIEQMIAMRGEQLELV